MCIKFVSRLPFTAWHAFFQKHLITDQIMACSEGFAREMLNTFQHISLFWFGTVWSIWWYELSLIDICFFCLHLTSAVLSYCDHHKSTRRSITAWFVLRPLGRCIAVNIVMVFSRLFTQVPHFFLFPLFPVLSRARVRFKTAQAKLPSTLSIF